MTTWLMKTMLWIARTLVGVLLLFGLLDIGFGHYVEGSAELVVAVGFSVAAVRLRLRLADREERRRPRAAHPVAPLPPRQD